VLIALNLKSRPAERMKNPLNYQTTEYDCGPTTLFNAVSFLFKREEIPPDIVKHIMLYCLDAYDTKGEFGKSGTSRMAMMFLSNWLTQFGKVKRFPIQCEFLTGYEVLISQHSKIVMCLQQGGAVVIRLFYGCWHYVLLTGVEGQTIEMFDPYYRKQNFRIPGIELVSNAPTRLNRRVAFNILNNESKGVYSLGPWETREAVLLYNEKTRKTPEKTIEYFI
jgi:hypothetical protein